MLPSPRGMAFAPGHCVILSGRRSAFDGQQCSHQEQRAARFVRALARRRVPRASASSQPPSEREGSGNGRAADAQAKAASILANARKRTRGVQRVVESAKGSASAAKIRYEAAAAAAKQLEESKFGSVLGSDLKKSALGRVSKVQDLEIPPGPTVQPLKPADVISALEEYVLDRASEEVAAEVVVALRSALDSLRRCVLPTVEAAEELVGLDAETSEETEEAVQSLFTLVELAGFHCNRAAPLRPAALNSFEMTVSVDGVLDTTIFSKSGASHPLIEQSLQVPEYFPHMLLAFRGTGVERDSGLLLGSKIRSLETYYLGWLNDPIQFARKLLAQRKSGKIGNGEGESLAQEVEGPGEDDASPRDDRTSRRAVVRRVFPSAKFSGWEGAAEFMLPVFCQEPAHSLVCVAYRKFTPDGALAREAKKKKLLEQARLVANRALHPTEFLREGRTASSDGESDSDSDSDSDLDAALTPGDVGPLRVELWRNVPWGHLTHFLPPFAVKLAPRAQDLLRVDFLTFAGLVSAVVTIMRGNASSGLLAAELIGTVAVYAVRIVLRLRSAVSRSRGVIAVERQERLAAADEPAVHAIGLLATQQQFGIAASIIAAAALAGADSSPPTTEEVQRSVFGTRVSDASQNRSWTRRLVRWELLEEDLKLRQQLGYNPVYWD